MKKRCIFIVIMYFILDTANAQRHEILTKDSLYVRVVGRNITDSLNNGTNELKYYHGLYYDFADSLSDGSWTMYEIVRKKKKLYAIGQFKNGARDGIFKYYALGENPKSVYTYKNGVLHGRYESYTNLGSTFELGNFFEGKRHGLFIKWGLIYPTKSIGSVAFYYNDTLTNYTRYFEGTTSVALIGKRINSDSSEITNYDTNNVVTQRVIIYQNGFFRYIEYHSGSDKVRLQANGYYSYFKPNADSFELIAFNPFSFEYKPYNGEVIHYDLNERILKTEIFDKGKKINP
ncbi:MAG: hypothetical protein MUE96_11965 [Bacteroidia bacterium]|jgi:antitoxin component YwqK of YwqJK toxin-antitoxin module|nr:hypothetical protein [Bacteroidia bacterium]